MQVPSWEAGAARPSLRDHFTLSTLCSYLIPHGPSVLPTWPLEVHTPPGLTAISTVPLSTWPPAAHTPHSSTESPRIHHPLSTWSLSTTKMVLTSRSVRSLPHNQHRLHLTVYEVFISHSMQSLPTTNMVPHLTLTGLHPTANTVFTLPSTWSSPQTLRNLSTWCYSLSTPPLTPYWT